MLGRTMLGRAAPTGRGAGPSGSWPGSAVQVARRSGSHMNPKGIRPRRSSRTRRGRTGDNGVTSPDEGAPSLEPERILMAFPTPLGAHGRELGVAAVGLAAASALAWAGATVHEGLHTATELAVARVAGAATATVLAEWERMLRDSEPPVPPAGERFRWSPREPELEPLVLRELRAEPGALSVFETLLAEAERRELVEQDPAGALEL